MRHNAVSILQSVSKPGLPVVRQSWLVRVDAVRPVMLPIASANHF